MPAYWMISNRAVVDGLPVTSKGDLKFYLAEEGAVLTEFNSWRLVTPDVFRQELSRAAARFPALSHGDNENQKHVTLLIHGYNTGWQDAATFYHNVCQRLYEGPDSLGVCISIDWPSLGSVLGYYPDRDHARNCAADLAHVLTELYDWALNKQEEAMANPASACRAKISIISHSMGNYLMQKAMGTAWVRKNKPLLTSLVNQLVMVAADVDNDLFEPSADEATDGLGIANLTYRVTSLYSGRDAVLGVSAGLKHFGARRLGRSGLAISPPAPWDNIWEIDCSSFFPSTVSSLDVHSEYFHDDDTIRLIRELLRGIDRTVLAAVGTASVSKWLVPNPPPPPTPTPVPV